MWCAARTWTPEAPGPQINSWQWRWRIVASMRWCDFWMLQTFRWSLASPETPTRTDTAHLLPLTSYAIRHSPIPSIIRSFRPLAHERGIHATRSSRHSQILARLLLDKIRRIFLIARFVVFPVELYRQSCPVAFTSLSPMAFPAPGAGHYTVDAAPFTRPGL